MARSISRRSSIGQGYAMSASLLSSTCVHGNLGFMSAEAEDIADLISELRLAYVALSLTPVLINQPDFLDYLKSHGFDQGTTVRLGRTDGTYYESLDVYASLQSAANHPPFNRLQLGMIFFLIFSAVGDRLQRTQYFDKAPVLEFFRHIRNGVSHGNRLHFLGPEPRRPASFRGFTLSAADHGKTLFFEYMLTGDAMDLLDDTEAHLRSLP